jgi:hypothetical protein
MLKTTLPVRMCFVNAIDRLKEEFEEVRNTADYYEVGIRINDISRKRAYEIIESYLKA